MKVLKQGEAVLLRDQGYREPTPEDLAGKSALPPHVEFLPLLQFHQALDVEQAVREGQIDVGMRLKREHGLSARSPDGNQWADWELFYRRDSLAGKEAARHVERLCAAWGAEYLGFRLHQAGQAQRVPPVRVLPTALSSPNEKEFSLLGTLLPLVLVLMTITGAVYPAIDLTAGERERGTLEILMAAPVPRFSLLLAKYVVVLTVAMLTALVNLGSMTATLLLVGLGPSLFGSGAGFLLVLLEVLGLLLLLAAFFAAVLLALTSVARSFKEAQAYLIPLMLVALTPGLLSLLPGLKLEGIYLFVPLLNIVLLARDLLEGSAQPLAASIVIGVTAVYAAAALALAARIFGSSAVAGSEGTFFERLGRLWNRQL
jgi:sodium transport system permease protein